MSHILQIFKINTTFGYVQMILLWFFHISISFRFPKISLECSVHILRHPWFRGMHKYAVPTYHLNGKNLLNNSSWDFEHIFDTRNSYGLCLGQNCFSKSLVFFVNPGLVKWRPLKQTKTQNGHHFFHQLFITRNFVPWPKKFPSL